MIKVVFIVGTIQLVISCLFTNDQAVTRNTAFLWSYGCIAIDLVVLALALRMKKI